MKGLLLSLSFGLAIAALAGCEDDPRDLDYLKDAGAKPFDAGSKAGSGGSGGSSAGSGGSSGSGGSGGTSGSGDDGGADQDAG